MPYAEIEYRTTGGIDLSSCRRRIPSRTRSWRCRINIRSVISGMLRLNSLVRSGPSISRQRIVPFQRPSITESVASIGHGETSFFETGIAFSTDDKFVSTLTSVSTYRSITKREVDSKK
jgi:hypothetical protein